MANTEADRETRAACRAIVALIKQHEPRAVTVTCEEDDQGSETLQPIELLDEHGDELTTWAISNDTELDVLFYAIHSRTRHVWGSADHADKVSLQRGFHSLDLPTLDRVGAEPKTIVHGPYKDQRSAEDAAGDLVDEVQGITLWSVVELYGPGHDHTARDGSGEQWGSLWVIPADALLEEFQATKSAESGQILTSIGYEKDNQS